MHMNNTYERKRANSKPATLSKKRAQNEDLIRLLIDDAR
jgi:hypothetical protein